MLKKSIRCTLLLCALACGATLTAQQNMILLKKGDPIPLEKVISKDQFGVMVPAGTNPENGDVLRKFIPFVDMNPASLSYFPFCDPKVVERIYYAVQDREKIIRKKFQDRYGEYEGVQDYTKNLTIHSGVHEYSVLFSALETAPTGMAGYLYSDAPDSLFYGKIFLYGLIGEKGDVWIGNIYPTDKTIQLNGSTYAVFTVIPPEKKAFGSDDADEEKKKKEDRRRPRGGRPGGQRNGPPPGR